MAVISTPLAPERKDPESLSGFRRVSSEIEKVWYELQWCPFGLKGFQGGKVLREALFD